MSSNTLTNAQGTWVATESSLTNYNGLEEWRVFDGSSVSPAHWYSAQNAYDPTTGVKLGTLHARNGYFGHWIRIDFPAAESITGVRLYGRTDQAGWDNFQKHMYPSTWRLFSSNDGITWIEAHDVVTYNGIGPNFVDGSAWYDQHDFAAPVTARYWQLVINTIAENETVFSAAAASISELKFITSSPCPAAGCLRIGTRTEIQGDVQAIGNCMIQGSLTAGGVLQDTAATAFGRAVKNTLTAPLIVSVPQFGAGEYIFGAFIPSENFTYNMGATAFGLIMQKTGYYSITSTSTIIADEDAVSYTVGITANNIRIAEANCGKMRDRADHVSLNTIAYVEAGQSIELRFYNASAAIDINVWHSILTCQRLLTST